jgi:hypothetical protein
MRWGARTARTGRGSSSTSSWTSCCRRTARSCSSSARASPTCPPCAPSPSRRSRWRTTNVRRPHAPSPLAAVVARFFYCCFSVFALCVCVCVCVCGCFAPVAPGAWPTAALTTAAVITYLRSERSAGRGRGAELPRLRVRLHRPGELRTLRGAPGGGGAGAQDPGGCWRRTVPCPGTRGRPARPPSAPTAPPQQPAGDGRLLRMLSLALACWWRWRVVRVRVETMGSQTCRIVGESQPSVLMMIDPMISPRVP